MKFPNSIKPFEIRAVCLGEAMPPMLGDTPEKICAYWQDNIANKPDYDNEKEHLYVFILNTKLKIKAINLVSIGGLSETIAHPREIFRPAIAVSGHSIILAHNHPSGDSSPSLSDSNLTKRVKECGDLLMVPLIDSLIIGEKGNEISPQGFFSFRQSGLIY